MMLVVGATGQLGNAVVARARSLGLPVRALVRHGAEDPSVRLSGVEIVFGDLCDRDSLIIACAGVSTVVATASVVFPRGDYSFQDEATGYSYLLEASRYCGVRRFIFISNHAPYTRHHLRCVPTLFYKDKVERMIEASGVPFTIFRSAPFMDDYFALIGSDLPLVGEPCATLKRPFWLSRTFVGLTGRLIERWGLCLIPGTSGRRHAFIAVEDVATFMVAAATSLDTESRRFTIGGPQVLRWLDVAALYSKLFGRKVRCIPQPGPALWMWARLLHPLSSAAANQIHILWLLSRFDADVDATDVAARFGVTLNTAHAYLSTKLEIRQAALGPP